MKKWFFLFCLFSLMSCEYKKEWSMSVSAPQHYGATIEAQYYLGEELLAAIKGAGSPGWGLGTDGLTMGEHDKKPIPDRVKIHCYSAREGVNYTADIPLPKKKMEELFKKTINDTVSWGEDETKVIDNSLFDIMCGCAPGGEIVIWLSNGKQLEEVTRVKGKEISRENQQQREAYFNNKTPEEQEWITNNPIPYGTWDKYDKEFLWKPDVLSNIKTLNNRYSIRINYTNGNFEFYNDKDWGYSEEKIKQSFNEVLLSNDQFLKRGIPFYIDLYLFSNIEKEALRYEFLLPTEDLKKIFEKYKEGRIVFEIPRDKILKVYFLHSNGTKILLKENIVKTNWYQ